MVMAFLCLLMLAQFGQVWVGGSSVLSYSKGCRADRIACLESYDESCFFLNGRAVDRVSFCGALELQVASGCFVGYSSREEEWRRIGEKYCRGDLPVSAAAHVECNSFTDLHRRAGRKLLLQLSANVSIISDSRRKAQSQDEKPHSDFSLSPEKMALAAPGMFLLCCTLLCPCFRARRKEVSEQSVLAKDLSSMDSVSSLEVSSTSERVPATPHRVPPSPSRFSMSPQLSRVGSMHLNISQIVKATHNFSPSLKIGEGGFGTVYKAVLPDGQVVAIKRARKEHFASLRTEFSNEVELLAKIEHRNLVKLLGYNDKGNERIIITEYVPNGTLREHLDGQHGKILDFNQRIEIAIDVAHALTYLHLYAEKTIIHRDVKSSNILLTESFRAKVADFGFARTGPTDADQTHISTKVKGTAGYLDPEYLKTYQLTPKSDVFSFGILLIEILSGRRPVELKRAADERITVRWAFKKYNEGNIRDVMDPSLEEVVDEEILSKIFGLAFQCAAPTRSDRPAMKEVGEQLWEIRKDYGRTLRRV